MIRKIFPQKNTKEAKEFCEEWDNSDHDDKEKLCIRFGVGIDSASKYRSRLTKLYPRKTAYNTPKEKEPLPIINLPKIKIREYVPSKNAEVEEEQIVVCSDHHADKISVSYNKEIYKERIWKLFNKIILIKKLQEHIYPINKLTLILAGDMVQGENLHQGSKVGDISMGAMEQVSKLAFPTMLEFIYSLKQHYTHITIECWDGNHGAISKEAPETSNWDLMLYGLLKTAFDKEKGIIVNIHEEFGSVIEIMGHRFFCTHGDGTTTNGGVPWVALSRKLKSWFMQFHGFEYAIIGHFHTTAFVEVGKKVELYMNGTMASDDDWALKKMGISSTPTQWTMGIHRERGITFQYPLNLE